MSYRAREQAALDQLALETLADPRATNADLKAARARLADDQGSAPKRLTEPELNTLRVLLAKLRGKPIDAKLEVVAIDNAIRQPPVLPCDRCKRLTRVELHDIDDHLAETGR